MQTIWLRAGNFALLILLLLIYYSLTFDVLLYIYMHPLDGVTLSCYVPICRLTDFVNRILVLNLNLSCLVSPIYKWTLQYPTLQETRGLWRWRSVRALKDTQDLLARYIALTLNSNTLCVCVCVNLCQPELMQKPSPKAEVLPVKLITAFYLFFLISK